MNRLPTPRHGHAPIEMRQVASHWEFTQLGDFSLEGTEEKPEIGLAIPTKSCPSGWTTIILPVCTGTKAPEAWLWDGDKERPTLSPSVHTHGHWHGWCRDGRLIEA